MKDIEDLFCKHIVAGLSKADAITAAGYSAKTRDNKLRQARRLLAKSYIKKRIQELKHLAAAREAGDIKAVKKVEILEPIEFDLDDNLTALEFFQQVYRDRFNPMNLRMQAASQAIKYEEVKASEKGKKEAAADVAKQQSTSGGFATLGNQLVQ